MNSCKKLEKKEAWRNPWKKFLRKAGKKYWRKYARVYDIYPSINFGIQFLSNRIDLKNF